MNNLLRTITTHTNINSELRLLLTNVKDSRTGDKAEPFFEALENVLNELRTVTLDNHDAEAFLRPVARSEFPDYQHVITDPMDFQTMQRRCKMKHYRSKADFNADLQKIWRNCYTYNAIEGHHLHKCVERLKVKAQRLLANITDRKDRNDPNVPVPHPQAPKIKLSLTPMRTGPRTFEDMPALVRTPEGMANFAKLESDLADGRDGERPRKRVKLEEGAETDAWWSMVRQEDMLANGVPPTFKSKPRRKKKLPRSSSGTGLLKLMNNNIRTLKRVRRTHAKFAALNEDAGEELDGVPDVDEIDDSPWAVPDEVGQQHADQCLQWMGQKILEHSGFQGTSIAALDVLAGVTSEYLFNVGRTIKYLSDKHGQTMSAEEIILHTLFESGVTRIQDLERYVKDDVERYGTRLGELEKKLVGAYRDAASGGIEMDDEAIFEDEDEDEAGILSLGDFADTLGMDYLGLRELGIADELGMTNLTVPKKLLRGRRRANVSNAPARPTSPPPPYPPPPPFVPLTASHIDEQIGLLRPLYRSKLHPAYPMLMDPSGAPIQPADHNDQEVADEAPAPGQVRMGPLGQIIGAPAKGGTTTLKKATGEKKKGVGGAGGVNGTAKKKKNAATSQQVQGVIVAKA